MVLDDIVGEEIKDVMRGEKKAEQETEEVPEFDRTLGVHHRTSGRCVMGNNAAEAVLMLIRYR